MGIVRPIPLYIYEFWTDNWISYGVFDGCEASHSREIVFVTLTVGGASITNSVLTIEDINSFVSITYTESWKHRSDKVGVGRDVWGGIVSVGMRLV